MRPRLKTKEQQHEEHLRRIKALRPIDDDFMRVLFKDNLPLAQMVLRIITGIEDLVLIEHETQYDLKRLAGSRSVCLDVMGTDSKNQKYDLEIQRGDKGARPHRARYHSSAMDVENLAPNEEFEKLPNTYVIFITENDIFGKGKAVYHIDRINTDTGELFGDGEHMIYVNGAYEDDSEIGHLMHDFRCADADDMHFELFAEKARYYKDEPKGVSEMCKIIEDMINEAREETRAEEAYQFALNMIEKGKLPFDEIAAYTGLTLEDVQEIAEENGIVTV